MNSEKYLCQLNVATMKTHPKHPSMKDFVDGLEHINQLAESHSGFVWRLKDDATGNASHIKIFGDNVIVNMSVWETPESLRDFVYKSLHKSFLARKSEWFEKMTVYQALWWVPKGHVPTLEEAKTKLELIREKGPTPEAFGLADALRGSY